jgi:hypothetical protein
MVSATSVVSGSPPAKAGGPVALRVSGRGGRCSHDRIGSLDELDPIYKRLLDEPVTAVFAVQGKDGRPNLTPMWFDYTGTTVLVNVASHRKKVEWIRANPRLTVLLMNPTNPYHCLPTSGAWRSGVPV